jgi:hypothetical protein
MNKAFKGNVKVYKGIAWIDADDTGHFKKGSLVKITNCEIVFTVLFVEPKRLKVGYI